MNRFWPRREDPEGFSIEKLAEKSKAKLAKAANRNFKEGLNPKNKEFLEKSNLASLKQISILREVNSPITSHWANRYYEEYREIA